MTHRCRRRGPRDGWCVFQEFGFWPPLWRFTLKNTCCGLENFFDIGRRNNRNETRTDVVSCFLELDASNVAGLCCTINESQRLAMWIVFVYSPKTTQFKHTQPKHTLPTHTARRKGARGEEARGARGKGPGPQAYLIFSAPKKCFFMAPPLRWDERVRREKIVWLVSE